MNAALYDKTVNALLSGAMSAAGAYVDDATATRIAERLLRARIRARCECGQAECFSYYFDVPAKPRGTVTYETVRFHARGEHLLHIDSDGDIYQVQRLYDLSARPVSKYERRRDGSWTRIQPS